MPRVIEYGDLVEIASEWYGDACDKGGQLIFDHALSVAMGVTDFGVTAMMVGLLHDVLEDTKTTVMDMKSVGVPWPVIHAVDRLTHKKGVQRLPYDSYIRHVSHDVVTCLVKIADNAHNSRHDRLTVLDPFTQARLTKKYRDARVQLYPHAHPTDIGSILQRVNPDLVPEMLELDR